MDAFDFVQELLASGRVSVPLSPQVPDELDGAVAELDRALRPQLAFDPPALAPDAARWGLLILYRACQFLVHRDIEADAIRAAFAQPCPRTAAADVCYSVDLSFRFLPDLLRLARGLPESDPLVQGVLALLRNWSLSSVGIDTVGNEEEAIETFIHHPSLRMLYIDRIIEHSDHGRLVHPLVKQAIRAALGDHADLCPSVASAL